MANTDNKPKRFRLTAIIVFDALIIIFLIIYFGVMRPHNEIKIHGTYSNTPINIGEFHLTDHHGIPFSKKNLDGHWSMIFFGFTQCEMICPTTLAELNKMYKNLQQDLPKHLLPHVIFISVDPENDTQEELNKYVNSFNSNFIALRGNIDQIVALQKQLHIPVSKDPIDHSTEIVVLNPQAQIKAYFVYPHSSEQLIADYKTVIKN